MAAESLEDLISLCKRRGFVFQSGASYGGLQGVYDFGPLGVELKNNLKNAWWRSIVYDRDDIEGLDSAILGHRLIYKYSGHETTFGDLLVDCKECKKRMRADHLKDGKCDFCSSTDLTEPRQFNLMLKTNVGPVEDDLSYAYLRPETAQGIFTNFKNVLDSTSRKVPFGVAQIGKAFRNEITPRHFLFRVREFEQMELEFFVEPGTDEKWLDTWVDLRTNWWHEQGLSSDNLKCVPQTGNELAHYAKATIDILYKFPHGFEELEGVANRTDYDLGSHSKDQDNLNLTAQVEKNTDAKDRLAYHDLENKKWVAPYVIEPSAGVDRGILALLNEAYTKEQLPDGKERLVLKLKPHLSPIKVAVLPLARNNEDIMNEAKAIKKRLQKLGLGRILFESTGNIGKGYRRHDEIGTPLCVTVDFETLENTPKTVTLRDRDTMEQKRIEIDALEDYVKEFYS